MYTRVPSWAIKHPAVMNIRATKRYMSPPGLKPSGRRQHDALAGAIRNRPLPTVQRDIVNPGESVRHSRIKHQEPGLDCSPCRQPAEGGRARGNLSAETLYP